MYHFRFFIITIKGIQSPINSITATETSLNFSLSIDKLRFPLSIIRRFSFILSAQRFLDLPLSNFEFCFQFSMLPSIPSVIHTKEAHLILFLLMISIILALPFNLLNCSFILLQIHLLHSFQSNTFPGYFLSKNVNIFYTNFSGFLYLTSVFGSNQNFLKCFF